MSTTLHEPELSPTAPHRLDSEAPSDITQSASSLTELSSTVLDGRYMLGKTLGTGGMGAVFEAHDLLLKRPVAVKIIRPAYAERRDHIKRFLLEAQAASKIRHRNVVVSLDYGETPEGLLYSVMELLAGQDLKQLLKESPKGRLPWSQACGLLIQLASGLKAAHDQGVIHRDIKPANCFVTKEDDQPVIKLVDFGIAKINDSSDIEQITRTSQVLGTPSYIAPELVRSKGVPSPRSDVYSLGIVAYRMLTGNLPFIGETAFEVMYRACTESPPRLRKQVPETPAGVETLILAMLSKKPELRPANMGVVRQRLQALEIQEADWHRRRTGIRILEKSTLVILLAALIWPTMSDRSDVKDQPAEVRIQHSSSAQKKLLSSTTNENTRALERGEASFETLRKTKQLYQRETNQSKNKIHHDSTKPVLAKPETTSVPKATHKPRETQSLYKPKHIASDAVLKKRLKRRIKARCNEFINKDIKIYFTITESGKVEKPTSTSKDTAGKCAVQQVQNIRFRPRNKKTITRLIVN